MFSVILLVDIITMDLDSVVQSKNVQQVLTAKVVAKFLVHQEDTGVRKRTCVLRAMDHVSLVTTAELDLQAKRAKHVPLLVLLSQTNSIA